MFAVQRDVQEESGEIRFDRNVRCFSQRDERLLLAARDILTDPIRIVQGEVGEANQDVTQIVHILPNGPSKWTWLLTKLVEFTVCECESLSRSFIAIAFVLSRKSFNFCHSKGQLC